MDRCTRGSADHVPCDSETAAITLPELGEKEVGGPEKSNFNVRPR